MSSAYPHQTVFARAVSLVRSDPQVGEENRKLILEFSDKCFADGLTQIRMSKLLYMMRYLAGYLKKPFSVATKREIQGVVAEIERSEKYKAWSKYDFKVVLKKFYKWLKGNDEFFPEEVRWIKPRINGGRRILPEDLITEEEVQRMAQAAQHPRDRALVMVLYESGCRMGEIASLHLKNLQFDQYGAVLRVRGKTGDRRVRVVSSAPLLASWLDVHPSRENPEAPLWQSRQSQYAKNIMNYASLVKILKTLAEKAGIRRRVYPHLFRHSRATGLASRLTEAQMKEQFGWVQASKMASVYVHLSGRDVDNAILETYGKATVSNKPIEKLLPKACPRCQVENSPISKFCSRCGSALNVEAAYQAENAQKADDVMARMNSDSEFKKVMISKMLESGLATA